MADYSVADAMRNAERAGERSGEAVSERRKHKQAALAAEDATTGMLAEAYALIADADALHAQWAARKYREIAAEVTAILGADQS